MQNKSICPTFIPVYSAASLLLQRLAHNVHAEQEQGQAAEQGKDIENSHFVFPHFDLTCYFPTL